MLDMFGTVDRVAMYSDYDRTRTAFARDSDALTGTLRCVWMQTRERTGWLIVDTGLDTGEVVKE